MSSWFCIWIIQVFQKRIGFSENFTRGWSAYKKGFGQVLYQWWLGNDVIHALTADHKQMLRVGVAIGTIKLSYTKYTKFWIDDETNNYKLTVSGYAGTAGMFTVQ